MKRFFLATLTLVALIALPALAGPAKEKEGPNRAVQGVVTDDGDNPVNGAIVQLKDTKTLQILSFITKTDGEYHFHGLNPNVDYELKADFKGAASGTKRLSSFDSRKVAIINLKLNK